MRGLNILVLLVLVLPTAQPGPSSSSDVLVGESIRELIPSREEGVLLTEACPGWPAEYVVMTNLGGEMLLAGMSVDDGEGNVTILANLTLAKGSSLAITVDGEAFSRVRPGVPFLEKGSADLRWGGRFVLADGGDEIMLRSSGLDMTDAIAYGASQYDGIGWEGPSLGSVPRGHAMVRESADTNTSADWSIEPPGRSHDLPASFNAIVEPFSIPGTAAGLIAREISLASRTVNCSVYEISDPFMVDQLVKCANRGLEVNVLIEGQPVGGLSDDSLDAIATLMAAGVDVRELRSVDSYKRYDYMHAKYMVVDHRRVTVMSENWGSGLYVNRGWGVIMDGVEAGAYYDRVFDGDFNGPIDSNSPQAQGEPLGPAVGSIAPDEVVRYRCEVTTLLSPDYSASSLKGLIDGATGRVLVEQLSVDPDWLDGPGLVTSLKEAAARGVTVRILLDSSWDREDNQAVADALNSWARSEGLDLEAKVITPYHDLSVMHNKGLIIDDLAIISSINWGDSALNQNREVGAAVLSEQIATFFSSLFWQDWALDPIPPEVCLPWTHIEVPEGQPVLLNANGSSDNGPGLSVEWDVDGDGTVDSNATSWAVKLPAGNHTIVLTVRDQGNNTVTATCWVSVRPVREPPFSVSIILLLAMPLVFIFVVMVWKRINDWKEH